MDPNLGLNLSDLQTLQNQLLSLAETDQLDLGQSDIKLERLETDSEKGSISSPTDQSNSTPAEIDQSKSPQSEPELKIDENEGPEIEPEIEPVEEIKNEPDIEPKLFAPTVGLEKLVENFPGDPSIFPVSEKRPVQDKYQELFQIWSLDRVDRHI